MFLAFLLLQFTFTSVVALSVTMGIVLLFASASEFTQAVFAEGWRWLHVGMAVLFVIGAFWAFLYPSQTFGTLALLFGWYLLIKGVFDITMAIALHGLPLWWFGLIAGFAEIALAFWCAAYPGRSAVMLILWVAIGAAMRGVVTIVAGFRIRHAENELGGL